MSDKKLKTLLLRELNIQTSGMNDHWTLHHTVKLIVRRKDEERIQELVDLFDISKEKKKKGLSEFYWWYKDNPISVIDSSVYYVYDIVSSEMGFSQVDPTYFSQRGENLYSRLKEWRGESLTEIAKILCDYFTEVISEVKKFNPGLVNSPKSLLEDYGWGLFEQWVIKSYGGKGQYLDASIKAIKKAEEERSYLSEIQFKRSQLLFEGKVREYDEIGRLLKEMPIKDVYERLQTG